MSLRLRGAWYGGAQDWEEPGMGEPVNGSEPGVFVKPKIKGSLVWWSPGLGGAWYG